MVVFHLKLLECPIDGPYSIGQRRKPIVTSEKVARAAQRQAAADDSHLCGDYALRVEGLVNCHLQQQTYDFSRSLSPAIWIPLHTQLRLHGRSFRAK